MVIDMPDALNAGQTIATPTTLKPAVQMLVRSHCEDEARRRVKVCDGAVVFLAEDALARLTPRRALERS